MGAPCFWLVFYLENHYPRCTGALSYPFNPPRYSSFRWIRAKSCAGYSLLKFSAKVVSERSRRKTGKQWHDDPDYDYATRNAAILSLDGMGFRQREIAEVIGISRRRVGQILQELARNGEPEFWEPYT